MQQYYIDILLLNYWLYKFSMIDFNISIEELLKLIQQKNILYLTNILLERIYKYIGHIKSSTNKMINPNIFLSIFIVNQYPDEILNSHKLSIEIYNLSNHIVELLQKPNQSKIEIYKLYNYLESYTKNFIEWKKEDANYIIKEMIYTYIELERVTIDISSENNNEDTQYILDKIKIQQQDIKKKITQIDKQNGMTILEKYLENFNTMNTLMKKNMELAYWDIFKEELTKQNYKAIVTILNDISNIIINLIPNRPDLHQEINDKIDIKLIDQMIVNEAIEPTYIYKLVNYIIEWCIKLDSVENEHLYENIKNKVAKEFETGFEYSEFFPNFFKEIIELLNNISIKVTKFRNSEIYKQMLDDLNR